MTKPQELTNDLITLLEEKDDQKKFLQGEISVLKHEKK